ncbi:hypothetical protein A2U01_0006282, partial [Trifolium medium]|nr:hypothetical protein [Trifolium medium]
MDGWVNVVHHVSLKSILAGWWIDVKEKGMRHMVLLPTVWCWSARNNVTYLNKIVVAAGFLGSIKTTSWGWLKMWHLDFIFKNGGKAEV